MIRVDIEALGEGQFVEIIEPKYLPWGIQKQVTTIVIEKTTNSAQLDVAELVAIEIIKSGNIVKADGQLVTFPLTADTVKDCPSAVIEAVTMKFTELKSVKPDRKN